MKKKLGLGMMTLSNLMFRAHQMFLAMGANLAYGKLTQSA